MRLWWKRGAESRPAPARRERYDWEFDGVVRLTRVGVTYIGATFVVAAAAVNTGNNALYIGMSLMLGLLLLSGIASKGGLRKLEAELSIVEEAWVERSCRSRVIIRNRSRRWNVRDVVIVGESLAEPVVVPLIRARSEVAVTLPLLFKRRGLAHLTAIDSYTRYPFGFIFKKRRLRVESEVVVFPKVLPGTPELLFARELSGDHAPQMRAGWGTELHSFRDYVRGDSLRQIHWKKSASIGRWVVKQTESETARTMFIVVDLWKPKGSSEEAFEQMISSATTLLYHAVDRGFDVTLSLPRLTLRARDRQEASPLFRALALAEPTGEPLFQPSPPDAVLFSLEGRRDDAKSA